MDLVTNVVRGNGQPNRLFLLLHGYGADEHDLAGLSPYLDPEGRFLIVCPRGPLNVPGTPGASWYEITQTGADGAGFVAALEAIDALLDATCLEHGFDRREALVGGFSQGGSLAMALGLQISAKPRPAGVVVLSGFMPDVPGVAYALDDPDALPPVFMAHGTKDQMLPLAGAKQAAVALARAGVAVEWREYPMQHQVALEEINDLRVWIDAVLAGERPANDLTALAAPAAPVDEGPVKTVTSVTFEQEVLKSEVPVIVDFWAPWCGPCRQVAPVVEQIARMRGSAYKVVKINIDENPDLAQTFQVQSIPLIGLFRNGRMERKSLGAKPRQQLEAELGMLVIP